MWSAVAVRVLALVVLMLPTCWPGIGAGSEDRSKCNSLVTSAVSAHVSWTQESQTHRNMVILAIERRHVWHGMHIEALFRFSPLFLNVRRCPHQRLFWCWFLNYALRVFTWSLGSRFFCISGDFPSQSLLLMWLSTIIFIFLEEDCSSKHKHML